MSVLRFLMMLSLTVWVGGIVFFAFVLAPTVFSVLPTRNLAGMVVNRSLGLLHLIGIVSGVVYLAASLLLARLQGTPALASRHLLVIVMIALVLISHLVIGARMNELRTQMGVIDDVPTTDARRISFNRLHVWSTRAEGAVLLLGLAVLFLTSRRLS